MSDIPKLTEQTIKVLQVLLSDPAVPRYGLEIARGAGLKTGTVHPILNRLKDAGLLESYWEKDDNSNGPRRRFYRFSGGAAETVRLAIAEQSHNAATTVSGRLRPAPGF